MAFLNNGEYHGNKYVERKISDSQTKLLVDTKLCGIFGNACKQKEEEKKMLVNSKRKTQSPINKRSIIKFCGACIRVTDSCIRLLLKSMLGSMEEA